MPHSFKPVWNAEAQVLILGSMPGEVSLAANEYYAHPRNAFWQVMAAFCQAPRTLPYAQRLERVQQAGIALWDMLESCQRQGSLDSAIVPDSVVISDLEALVGQMPKLQLIATNGGTATRLYQRHWAQKLEVRHVALPSTSPAYASLSAQRKVALWLEVLLPVLPPELTKAASASQTARAD